MIRTRVGYAGGSTDNPTYRNIGDHSETIQLDFDPTLISFEEIVELFWKHHNPLYEGRPRQYLSILLCHNPLQVEQAQSKKVKWEHIWGGSIQTEITACRSFTLAEDYHQKYYLKRYKAATETLLRLFPDHAAFIDATLTARLNGFVKEFGSWNEIKAEIRQWGHSERAKIALLGELDHLRW